MRPVANAPWVDPTAIDRTWRSSSAAPAERDPAVQHDAVLLHDVWWPLTEVGTSTVPGSEPRMVTEGLDEHLAHLGPRPSARDESGRDALLAALDTVDLTGHGGAHVPVAVKWRAALRADGPLTVVANGAESEPLSSKDATLLRQRPHLVLDGLSLAAEALGARRVVVWLHGDDAGTRRVVQAALAGRRAAGEQGPTIEVVSGPSHYLAGESSAIAQALHGGPALPTVRRPGKPGAPRTLVHNVETLARLALLARGRPAVDTMLLTIVGPYGRHVREVRRGTSLVEALHGSGWPASEAPVGVLLGGFGGTWVAWDDVLRATVDEQALRAVGLSLGAGIVAPLPAGACPVAETAAITAYLASMSARQCGPCLFGLPALAGSVRRLADSSAPRGERRRLVEDLRAVAGRGACHHPDGSVRLIGSMLSVFGEHVDHHARGRRCTGGVVMPVPEVSR